MQKNIIAKEQRSDQNYCKKAMELKLKRQNLLSKKSKIGYHMSINKLLQKKEVEEERIDNVKRDVNGKEFKCSVNNIKLSSIQNPKLIGIINVGNSCYFSSIFQCLVHISKEIIDEIMKLNGKEYVCEIQKMINFLMHSKSNIKPIKEYEFLTRDFAPLHTQQDAEEYFLFLLHKISEETESLSFESMFKGKIINSIRCEKCNAIREYIEDFIIFYSGNFCNQIPFRELEIPIIPIGYRCDSCSRQNTCLKYQEIYEYPSYLVIRNK